eukprot:1556332-Amphidinium_carterae.2
MAGEGQAATQKPHAEGELPEVAGLCLALASLSEAAGVSPPQTRLREESAEAALQAAPKRRLELRGQEPREKEKPRNRHLTASQLRLRGVADARGTGTCSSSTCAHFWRGQLAGGGKQRVKGFTRSGAKWLTSSGRLAEALQRSSLECREVHWVEGHPHRSRDEYIEGAAMRGQPAGCHCTLCSWASGRLE